MRQKIYKFLTMILAIMVSCNLLAQVDASLQNPDLQERLDAVAKHKMEIQQTVQPESVDDYCIPGGNCSLGDGFTDFAFAGIENYGSGCSPGGYGDFTTMQGTAEIGYAYTATFATGYSDQYASMWIDFNDDEVFSDMERILTDFNIASVGTFYEVDVTIPGNAAPGVHRLRIGANWADPSSPDPCATFTYGEWEDYTIEITGEPISYNAILASIDMASVMLAGEIIPMATVANMGVETISFPVTMTEPTTGYSSTVDVQDLGMGQSLQVEFDPWNVEIGTYDIEICTELSGDEIPDDDCKSLTIAISDQPRQKVVAEFFTGTW